MFSTYTNSMHYYSDTLTTYSDIVGTCLPRNASKTPSAGTGEEQKTAAQEKAATRLK